MPSKKQPAARAAPKDPVGDKMAEFHRSPTALGTEDPAQRRLGEPGPDEPSAAADPNNPNRNPDAMAAVPVEGGPDERLAKLVEPDAKGAYKTGANALLARYLENHGRWQNVQHRRHDGTTTVRAMVWCACPICADARAFLKMED